MEGLRGREQVQVPGTGFPPNPGFFFDAPKRPSQPPQREDFFFLFLVQDVAQPCPVRGGSQIVNSRLKKRGSARAAARGEGFRRQLTLGGCKQNEPATNWAQGDIPFSLVGWR
jgi:hypothetical protein